MSETTVDPDPTPGDGDGNGEEGRAGEGRGVRSRRRGRTAAFVALAAFVVFAALAVVMASRLGGDPQYRGTALLGDPVPELELPTLEGGEIALGDMRGRAVLVNFFNSWCVPCEEELPALKTFYGTHGDEPDFEMVGIVRDDTEQAVREWRRTEQVRWPIALDPGARASIDFATSGQPETYAIDPGGTVVGRHLGRATLDDLENLLALARGRAGAEASGAQR